MGKMYRHYIMAKYDTAKMFKIRIGTDDTVYLTNGLKGKQEVRVADLAEIAIWSKTMRAKRDLTVNDWDPWGFGLQLYKGHYRTKVCSDWMFWTKKEASKYYLDVNDSGFLTLYPKKANRDGRGKWQSHDVIQAWQLCRDLGRDLKVKDFRDNPWKSTAYAA